MDAHVIGNNLRRLRSGKGLSQLSLSQASGLSVASIRSIEKGEAQPRARSLDALAHGLGVGLEELLTPVKPLTAVRFRSNKRLHQRAEVLARASRWLNNYLELEELLGQPLGCQLDLSGHDVQQYSGEPLQAARHLRKLMSLDFKEPIHDIWGLLEARGIRLFASPMASEGFFGLSIAASDGGPAIVVNTWERIPVERWIFTAAHELGHLVLHQGEYDASDALEDLAQEDEANAFASEFLMPEAAFQAEWQEARGLSLVDRVLKVKRIFKVSYKTVLYRIQSDHPNIWAHFYTQYKQQYGTSLANHKEPEPADPNAFGTEAPARRSVKEPQSLQPADFRGDRLAALVRQALESGEISLSRAGEILGFSTGQMRQVAQGWVA